MRLPTATLFVLLAAAGCGAAEGGAGAGPQEPAKAEKPVRVVTEGLPAQFVGPLEFAPGGFDLGAIDPNSKHKTRFTLTNHGSEDVTIVYTSVDCSCTVPENLDGTVIPPGESVPFDAMFTARASPGEKAAKMLMNFRYAGQMNKALLRIRGDVTMAVQATPPYVDALKGVKSGTVRVESTDGRAFRVRSAFGREPVFAGGFDPAADEPRRAYTLAWSLDYPDDQADCGGEKLWWVIETDHPDCPVLPLRIRHECTGMLADRTWRSRGWLFKEYMVNLGGLTAGEPIEIDVPIRRIDQRASTGIHAVESLDPRATAELVQVIETPDEEISTCRVRFTPGEDARGLLYAMVNFKSQTGDKETAFLARVSE